MKKTLLFFAALVIFLSACKPEVDVSYEKKKAAEEEPYKEPEPGEIEASYNLEGDRMKKYLDEVQYDTDYSYTKIYDYVKEGQESDAYKPAYVMVPADKDVNRVVLVSDRGEETEMEIKSTGKVAIYGLIPGRTYTYTLYSADGQPVRTARFTTEGRVRAFKTTKYLHNFRDIGGWEGLDGKHIKYGWLIRGSEVMNSKKDLSKYEQEDYDLLINQLGVDYDLDLRSNDDVGQLKESPLGIEFRRISLSAYDSVIEKKDRHKPYLQCIRQFIENTKAGKVTYVHCQGGADRTGTLVFFIEGLLGVSESDLAKDYEITTFYYHKQRNDPERYKPMIEALMKLYSNGGTLHDAIYNCAKTMGVTDENINELRSLMLE